MLLVLPKKLVKKKIYCLEAFLPCFLLKSSMVLAFKSSSSLHFEVMSVYAKR